MKKTKASGGNLKGVRVRSQLKAGVDECQLCHQTCRLLSGEKKATCKNDCDQNFY
jgi:hypothetical protein